MKGPLTVRFPALKIAVFCLSFVAVASVGAELRVLPEESIAFTGFLRKADFDKRFPGEVLASNGELVPGWYVSYEHESLRYFFGPILLESTGEDYRNELETIVEAAVSERPSISGYRINLTYEPSEEPASNEQEERDEGMDTPAPPQPKRSFGLFDLIRRIFRL